MKKVLTVSAMAMFAGVAFAGDGKVFEAGQAGCRPNDVWDGKVSTPIRLSLRILDGQKVVNDVMILTQDGKTGGYRDVHAFVGGEEGVSVLLAPQIVNKDQVDVTVCMTKTDLVPDSGAKPGTVRGDYPNVEMYRVAQRVTLDGVKPREISVGKYTVSLAATVE